MSNFQLLTIRLSEAARPQDVMKVEQLKYIIKNATEYYPLLVEINEQLCDFYTKMDNNYHFEPPKEWLLHSAAAYIHSDQITVESENKIFLRCMSPLGLGSVPVSINFYEGVCTFWIR
jgi:hypothetical protein